jgi:hypothetical protein
MIFCTLTSLFLAVSAIRFVFGFPTSVLSMPSWAIALIDVVWGLGDILVLIATILMWGRKSVGRATAIIGLSC